MSTNEITIYKSSVRPGDADASVKRSLAEKAKHAEVVPVPKKPFLQRLWGIGNAMQGLDRRQFEGRLSKLIGSALAHEQEGLAAGSNEYKRLHRMANESIDSYCTSRQVDRADLEAQIPAMNKLRNLANPAKPKSPAWMNPATLVMLVVAIALIGAALGFGDGLFVAVKAHTVHMLLR